MTRSDEAPTTALTGVCAVLLVLIALVHVAGYATTTLVTDTARDLGAAWRIVHGLELPLRGPEIGQRWSLGPVWFYLLAPIVDAARSVTAIALAVGVLAALKFALAWRLGRTLVDARFGFLFAFVLALPGWASLEHVVFAHTNLAGTAMLAYGLALVAATRGPDPGRCALVGLALALAVHAHPGALVLAAFALVPVVAAPRGGTVIVRVAACAAGFALPFIPMLVAEARDGWPMLVRSEDYVAGSDLGARLVRVPAVLAGTWAAPVELVRAFLLPANAVVRAVWLAGVLAIVVGAAAGLARGARRRVAVTAVGFGVSLAAGALIALLREAIAFYFVLPLVPLVALLVAAALDASLTRHRALVTVAVGVFALGASVAVLAQRVVATRDGEQSLPRATLGDIAQWPAPDPVPVDYQPVAGLERATVPALCAHGDAVTVHGDLAGQLELAQGLPLAYACPALRVTLAGPAPPALAGLPRGLLARAGAVLDPAARGTVLLDDVTPLHPPEGNALALREHYPPHPFELAPDETVTLAARADAAAFLAITELNPAFVATAEPRVEANGAPQIPRARSAATRVYRCDACEGEVRWTIAVEAGDPRWLDVFLFPHDVTTAQR